MDSLLSAGKLEATDIMRARSAQEQTGSTLSSVLVRLGLCAENDLIDAMSDVTGIERIQLEEVPDLLLHELDVDLEYLRSALVLPVNKTDRSMVLAMADVIDDEPARVLAFKLGIRIEMKLATPAEIERILDTYMANQRPDEVIGDATLVNSKDVERLKDLASEVPVIQRLNKILTQAVQQNVSDVHIESEKIGATIRYRIDGVMRTEEVLPANMRDAVMTRLKVISGLDLSERRLPQDGRAQIVSGGRSVDLRVATIPTLHGESAVVRILDRETALKGLEELGFNDQAAAQLRHWLSMRQGLICVTGPTGSGKTTTLYAALMEFDASKSKIISVEDPVEYELDGVNQVQVNDEIGFTFARALRSLLRHNPNVIMLGEIRDAETARIAIQSAQTGHLVLATLHTNDAVSAVVRLVDMGIEPYLLSATLTGVAAQRLVRMFCQVCSGEGCDSCNGSGFKGRTALLELLNVDQGFRQSILTLKSGGDLYEAARKSGWKPLAEIGTEAIENGFTSEQEVLSATLSSMG